MAIKICAEKKNLSLLLYDYVEATKKSDECAVRTPPIFTSTIIEKLYRVCVRFFFSFTTRIVIQSLTVSKKLTSKKLSQHG